MRFRPILAGFSVKLPIFGKSCQIFHFDDGQSQFGGLRPKRNVSCALFVHPGGVCWLVGLVGRRGGMCGRLCWGRGFQPLSSGTAPQKQHSNVYCDFCVGEVSTVKDQHYANQWCPRGFPFAMGPRTQRSRSGMEGTSATFLTPAKRKVCPGRHSGPRHVSFRSDRHAGTHIGQEVGWGGSKAAVSPQVMGRVSLVVD